MYRLAVGRFIATVCAFVALATSGAAALDTERSELAALLEHEANTSARPLEREALRSFYLQRGFIHAWVGDAQASGRADALIAAVRDAGSYGLRTSDYASLLNSAADPLTATAEKLARRDIAVSLLALRFSSDLHNGRVAARSAGFDLPSAHPDDPVARLTALTASSDIRATLATFEPRSRYYDLLKQALPRYGQLATDASLTSLPEPGKRTLEPGDPYVGAAQLRRLLLALGDLQRAAPSIEAAPETYDADLSEAVGRFQQRHGLLDDRRLGKRTFAALTVPLAQRVRQLELAMERWRWLPPLDPPVIVINIPQFMLFALSGTPHDPPIEMPVIVGRTRDRTPVFTSAVESIVFRPYWDVPRSILHEELLPQIRADSGYLERHHMEIVDGGGDGARVVPPTDASLAALEAGALRLRQRPGTDNALGPIKFILPNEYNVYLHSTPNERLFGETRRSFSHGCIRLGDPVALAVFVLRGNEEGWTAERVEAAMCAEETKRVTLQEPVRVLVLYGTAVATQSRGLMFFEDLYGHDRRLEQLLGLGPVQR